MAEVPGTPFAERLDTCPLCGCTSWKTLSLPGRWIGEEVFGDLRDQLALVRCNSCELVFTNPRPSRERLTAFYSGDTYSCHEASGSASAGATADFVLERIARYFPREAPKYLLDYGAGGGGFLSHALKCGWRTKGFEPGKRGLEACRHSGLDVTDRLEEIPSETFGLVTMFHVFEHLSSPTEVLEGARRFLANTGKLYLEVPNVRSLRARLALPYLSRRFQIDERHRAFPIHLMYYSDRTLREMLTKSGWTVERTFTLGLGLDEYFIHSESPHEVVPKSTISGIEVPTPKRRLRHVLRDSFLGLGIGENLAAIAYPNRP